ncbi:DUF4175 family protein [Mucilaginibacter calamicampi]|uniref:DUF4175 family protein n=1 Tax=Mucilaginibacter calamicampi TaxID=1302352 RepID=A0ABW2Z242_9SPHI
MNSHGNYELLIDKINTFIKRYYLNSLLRGLIFLGAGLFSAYIVITLSEYFGNFDSLFRSVLFYGFILLNLGLIAWLVVPPLMAWLALGKTLTHDQAADIIGKHFNDVNDKLLNTLQLKKLSAEESQHQDLIQASIDQKIDNLRPIRFPSAINLRENRRYLKWVLAPAGVIIVLAFAAPSMLTESTKRILRHNEYFAPVAPFKFVVLNRTLSVVQGDDLNLELKLEGDKFPADVYIEMGNNTFKLDKENVSRFKYLFSNLQESTKFRLSGNGFNSVPYEIKVNPRPALLHFDVVLNYPPYLHKPSETLANAGDITIPAGTTVTWKFHTQNATGIAFNMGNKQQMLQASEANLFSHSERILANTIYKLSPVNQIVNTTDSAAYRINAIADEAPAIDVAERPDSVSMKAFYFTGKIQDDHGFSNLTFHYKISPGGGKANEKSFVKPVKADLGVNISDFFYYWNLKDLGVRPGDQVTYFFEVADNDGVSGPKKVQSPERSINVPDAMELENELNKGTEQVRKNIQQAAKLAAEIERESQKMNELLLSKSSISFDEQKQLDALMEKRRELDDLVKQIQSDNRKNMFNRRENQQQNQQLAEEQKQVEKLLNDVLDPKTRELLDKLQQLARNNQKESTRDQLQKMQMDNKSLKREFGRLEELYKKMAFDQKVNQNINKLSELADKQEKLADETEKPVDPAEAQKQENKDQKAQEAQKQAAEALKKALQDAQKQTAEVQKNQQQSQEQKAQQKAQQDALKQAIDQVKKALQEAQKQAAEMQKNQAQNQEQKGQHDAQKQDQKAQADAQKQAEDALKKAIEDAQKKAAELQNQQNQQQQQNQNQQNQQQQNQGQQQQKAQQEAQKQTAEELKKAIQEAQKQAAELQKQQEQGQQQGDQKSGDQQQQQSAEQQKSAQEEKQQDKLNKEFEDIKKSMEELAKEAEKMQSRQDFENPKSEQESIQDKMEQSKQQLSKSNRSKASQSQQQAAQQMKKMAQKMQQQQEEEEEEDNAVNIKQLRELLKSLVNSSFRQEKTMEALKNTSQLDPNYVTLAQTQKTIKDNLKTAEDSLYAISKRVPQIEATVNREISAINDRIDQALENLGDRRTSEANRNQQYAMTSMNNLALMLSDALNNMQAKANEQKSGSSSKKSKSQRMQQLSQQQQKLNQNMQRAREQMQREQQQQQQQGQQQQQQGQQNRVQGQQQRGMSEQLARMAREQQMIRQEMQRLNNEDRRDGGTGIKDLDKISQQMEQSENDIVNRRITEEALKRQQQIQIRMLEAEKAAQEQEQEQQREGHAGKDMPPGYIKALQDYQQVKEKQTEQIRTVPPALNLYYKKKIKTYFDQLNIN